MNAPKRERRHLAAGVAASTLGQIGGVAAAAVAGIAIARMLGPVGTGTFALVMNLFAVVTLVVGLGMRQGITYMVSHGRWAVPEAVRTSQLVAFGLGLAGGAIGFGLYELTSENLLEGLTTPMALAVLAAVPFGLSWLASCAVTIARDHYEAYGIFQFLPFAGVLVFSVTLAAIIDVGGAVAGFALAQGVAALIAGAWVIGLARRERRASKPASAGADGERSAHPLRETFHFGLRSWGSDILQFLNYRVDLFILNAYAAAADVGIYSVAVAVTTLGLLLPGAFNTVLLPRTADLDAAVKRGEIPPSESDATASKAARHGVLLMLPSAIVLALLMVCVPFLYGDKFTDSVALGMILIPGIVARGLSRVVNPITAGRGFVRYPLYIGLMTGPPTIGLYLLLVPSLEATGAALASTCSYLATSLLSVLFFHRATRIRFRDALIPRGDDVRDYRFALRQAREYLRGARSRIRAAPGG